MVQSGRGADYVDNMANAYISGDIIPLVKALKALDEKNPFDGYTKQYRRLIALLEYGDMSYARHEKPKREAAQELYQTYLRAKRDLENLTRKITGSYQQSEQKQEALRCVKNALDQIERRFNSFAEEKGDLRIGDFDPDRSISQQFRKDRMRKWGRSTVR